METITREAPVAEPVITPVIAPANPFPPLTAPEAPYKAARRKFIAALRSGKYRQIRMLMRGNDNERCALGVAAEVVLGYGFPDTLKWGDFLMACVRLERALNISHDDIRSIWLLNDGGNSFADIADRLEKLWSKEN